MPDQPLRVSYSAVQDWRACEQRYWYRHVSRLKPRIRDAAPELGSMIHEYFEGYYRPLIRPARRTVGQIEALHRDALVDVGKRYRKQTRALARTAEAVGADDVARSLLAIPYTARDLIVAYQRVHGAADVKEHKIVLVEEEFELEVRPGIVLPGKIDMVTKRGGQHWLWEHKTTGSIPEQGRRFRDLQTLLYAVALEELHGIRIDGVIWNYVRTKPPHPPALLKKGELSRDKNQTTTYDLYVKAIREHDLDPKPYRPFLRMLEERERTAVFPRFALPVVQAERVLLRDYVLSVRQIERARNNPKFRPVRNLSPNCDWCPYLKLCHAAIVGGDQDELTQRYYRIDDTAKRGGETDGSKQDGGSDDDLDEGAS